MAKGKGEVAGWITRNGVHVPIYGNYTVRGGEEPKAKGSKFKGAGKKRKKVDTSKTSGKTANDLNSNLKKKGLELDSADLSSMAHKDFNDEKVTMYDEDGNTYEGTYNKYKNGDREIVDIKKTGGRDTGKSEVSKGHTEEGKGAVKDVEGKKPVTKAEESSKVDRKQDAIDYIAKREDVHPSVAKDTYEHMSESERNHVANEAYKRKQAEKESSKATPESYAQSKDKAAKKEGFSDAEDKELFEAREKAYETRGLRGQAEKEQSSLKAASNGAPRVTDEEAKSNKVVDWEGQKYSTQPVIDWDNSKNEEYVAGHLYVPIVEHGTGKDVHQFFVANEDGSVHHSGSEYLRQKNALPNPWKEKAAANKAVTSKNDEDDGIISPASRAMKNFRDEANAEGKTTYTLGANGKWKESAGTESSTETTNPKPLWQTDAKIKKATPVKSGKYSLKTSGPFKFKDEQESSKESKAIGTIPTTVSGLRSAYAEATGSEKAEIASLLRRKGYSLVGGKWIKA